jgi:hypothetical protein
MTQEILEEGNIAWQKESVKSEENPSQLFKGKVQLGKRNPPYLRL